MNPEAVIFDLDGVITDTAHLHFHAWRQVASEIGIEIDEAFNNTLKGISRGESLRRILHFGGREADFSQAQRDELATRKNSIYVESLNQLTAQSILPGIHDLLLELKQRGIPTGLASVSLNAPTILNMLGITDLFTFCADAGKIARSKPDPEIFLAACHGLGVCAQQCIGIEDAQAGIDAINACGMRSIGIGADLQHAGLRLLSTDQLTWPCLSAFWQRAK